MLPPVQTASRSTLAFAENASEAAPSQAASSGVVQDASQDQATQADDSSNTASAVLGRINNLLLNSRESVRADMATIADMVGSSINIKRMPGESDGAFAARFVTALAHLSDSQRTALQTQLNQVLKGLQVQVLLQVLQNQDGPEAALLSAYMEIQRSNSDNLKAQTVVASYSQNADSTSEDQSALLNTPRSASAATTQTPITQTPITPQSSITIALQASIAGAKDKEEAIAKLAAALRLASSGTADDAALTQLTTSAAFMASPEEEVSRRATIQGNAEVGAGKTVNQDFSAIGNGAKPAQDVNGRTMQSATAASQTAASTQALPPTPLETAPTAAKQTAPHTTLAATMPPSAQSAEMIGPQQRSPALAVDTHAMPLQSSQAVGEDHQETNAPVVSNPMAGQPQAAPTEDQSVDSAVIVATALAAGGLINTASIASQSRTDAQTAADSALLHQMFFQNSETQEVAEVVALRALANRSDSTQNANTDTDTKAILSEDAQPEQQGAEKTASRSQAALSLAAAQTMATAPIAAHIVPPLGVPLLVGNYLAMQDPPNSGTGDISVDAIDALSDEEPRRDSNRRNPKQDQSTPDEQTDEEDSKEDGLYAISDAQDADQDALFNGSDAKAHIGELAALPAPQDELVAADMLYWKIADLA